MKFLTKLYTSLKIKKYPIYYNVRKQNGTADAYIFNDMWAMCPTYMSMSQEVIEYINNKQREGYKVVWVTTRILPPDACAFAINFSKNPPKVNKFVAFLYMLRNVIFFSKNDPRRQFPDFIVDKTNFKLKRRYLFDQDANTFGILATVRRLLIE
jgi:hypothetical protein